MKEHNLGEQVFKDTRVKGDDGKDRKIIDIAEDTWGGPELKSLTDNRAPESTHLKTGDASGSKTDAHSREADLSQASHRLKELNNLLHQPGKPLAGSDLELIGFDKKGRLLLIHRAEDGQVDGKVLVDGDNGKIVARTKPDDLNHWEKSTDYEKSGKATRVELQPAAKGEGKEKVDGKTASLPQEWTKQEQEGSAIFKDRAGHVMAVMDSFGDSRLYKRDHAGHLTEVAIKSHDNGSGSGAAANLEVYRRGPSTGGIENELWYKMPYKPEEKPQGFKIEVGQDGTLTKSVSNKERRIYMVDGSIVEENGDGRKTIRKAQPLMLPGNGTLPA